MTNANNDDNKLLVWSIVVLVLLVCFSALSQGNKGWVFAGIQAVLVAGLLYLKYSKRFNTPLAPLPFESLPFAEKQKTARQFVQRTATPGSANVTTKLFRPGEFYHPAIAGFFETYSAIHVAADGDCLISCAVLNTEQIVAEDFLVIGHDTEQEYLYCLKRGDEQRIYEIYSVDKEVTTTYDCWEDFLLTEDWSLEQGL